jgi:hypothetical protein
MSHRLNTADRIAFKFDSEIAKMKRELEDALHDLLTGGGAKQTMELQAKIKAFEAAREYGLENGLI